VIEPLGLAADDAPTLWWEALAEGTDVPVALVRIERVRAERDETDEVGADTALRQQARFTAGVEYIAAQPSRSPGKGRGRRSFSEEVQPKTCRRVRTSPRKSSGSAHGLTSIFQSGLERTSGISSAEPIRRRSPLTMLTSASTSRQQRPRAPSCSAKMSSWPSTTRNDGIWLRSA
jgi:hypothetical protein